MTAAAYLATPSFSSAVLDESSPVRAVRGWPWPVCAVLTAPSVICVFRSIYSPCLERARVLVWSNESNVKATVPHLCRAQAVNSRDEARKAGASIRGGFFCLLGQVTDAVQVTKPSVFRACAFERSCWPRQLLASRRSWNGSQVVRPCVLSKRLGWGHVACSAAIAFYWLFSWNALVWLTWPAGDAILLAQVQGAFQAETGLSR